MYKNDIYSLGCVLFKICNLKQNRPSRLKEVNVNPKIYYLSDLGPTN